MEVNLASLACHASADKKKTHRLFLKKPSSMVVFEENQYEIGEKSLVFNVFGVISFLCFYAGKTNYDNLIGKSFARNFD